MKLAAKTFIYVRKQGTPRNAKDKTLKKLISHPLLSDAERALSAEAKKLYYTTVFLYHYHTGDYLSAYKTASQSLRFVESNCSTILLWEENYSVVLNNLTIIQDQLGKYQEALLSIQKHRSLVNKSGTVRMHAFVFSYINETGYYLRRCEFEEGAAIIKDIEKELDTLKSNIPHPSAFILYANIVILYFGAGEYHKSLVWINKIIHHPKIIVREDVQAWSRILQILTHYELDNHDIMNHLVVSAVRFLVKRKQLYKVEESFMHFILRVSKTDTFRSEKLQLKEFRRFRDELVHITKNPEEKKAMEHFDLISWVESKIQNRPFADIAREKATLVSKEK